MSGGARAPGELWEEGGRSAGRPAGGRLAEGGGGGSRVTNAVRPGLAMSPGPVFRRRGVTSEADQSRRLLVPAASFPFSDRDGE